MNRNVFYLRPHSSKGQYFTTRCECKYIHYKWFHNGHVTSPPVDIYTLHFPLLFIEAMQQCGGHIVQVKPRLPSCVYGGRRSVHN